MRLPLLAILLLGACAAAPRSAPEPETPLSGLASAVGADAWKNGVESVRFTWHHLGRNLQRTYEWNRSTGRIRATADGKVETFPASGPGELHPAFVNDSYWFLFEYMIFADGSEKSSLAPAPVPGFPGLGELRAIEVRYAKDEGYTGGDRYVLYLDERDIPVAWAFHKGGADEPTLVTTRGGRIRKAGMLLPTEFAKADGTVVIRIEGIEVEAGGATTR
jgi:hypothetical protein